MDDKNHKMSLISEEEHHHNVIRETKRRRNKTRSEEKGIYNNFVHFYHWGALFPPLLENLS